MKIVGGKFFNHDSALCCIDTTKKDIFAISTERITRIKHDYGSVLPILQEYPVIFNDIDFIACGFSSFQSINNPYGDLVWSSTVKLKYELYFRKIFKPRYIGDIKKIYNSIVIKLIIKTLSHPLDVLRLLYFYGLNKLSIKVSSKKNRKYIIKTINYLFEGVHGGKKLNFFDHHLCHAYASYFFSGFPSDESSLLLTLDGSGDGFFSKAFLMHNEQLNIVGFGRNSPLPGISNEMTSLGGAYERFTNAMDLIAGSDEGKVEAYAAYGYFDEALLAELNSTINVDSNEICFNPNIFEKVFEEKNLRKFRSTIGDANFCATIQHWLNEVVVGYLNLLQQSYPGITNLAISGGVAANIILNMNINLRTKFKGFYILPFMGDEGVAIGAALLQARKLGIYMPWLSKNQMPYFGDSYCQADIIKEIHNVKSINIEKLTSGDSVLMQASDLHRGKIIARFYGRSEFGPRALGNRSIIASATDPQITLKMNSSIKRRPWYQPFCPTVLDEEREIHFTNAFKHKHMATAFNMRPSSRDVLPAAAHIDGTARVQFLSQEDNPQLYEMLKEYKRLSGFGVVLNTSFNLHGRTIVRTPTDAVSDFLDCNIDVLYMEDLRITKSE